MKILRKDLKIKKSKWCEKISKAFLKFTLIIVCIQIFVFLRIFFDFIAYFFK